MTAEIINLRHVRKGKARTAAERKAEANRLAFGRTKSERVKEDAEHNLAAARLDAHRLNEPKD